MLAAGGARAEDVDALRARDACFDLGEDLARRHRGDAVVATRGAPPTAAGEERRRQRERSTWIRAMRRIGRPTLHGRLRVSTRPIGSIAPRGLDGHPSSRRGRRPTSTRRSTPTAGSSAPSSSFARRWPTRASTRRSCASATAGSSCSPRSGPTRRSARFLDRRGPGMHHVAFEVDDVARRARAARRRRRRADRRAPAAGADRAARSRSSTRTPPAACSRSWWRVADAERVRLEIAFRERAVADGQRRRRDRPTSSRRRSRKGDARRRRVRRRGRPLHRRSIRMIAFVKRHVRESRVGFGSLARRHDGARSRDRRPAGRRARRRSSPR